MSIETSATSVSQDSHSIPPKTTHEKGAEIKRRSTRKTKVALLIGYDGSPFHGMQFNHDPQHPTIEEALYRTLCDANLISESNRGEDWYKKVSWQRASRTDRGVHALRNLVSLRIEHDNGEDVVQAGERLKRALTFGPYKNSLILYSLLPTTRSFNCYEMCTHREYTYILPAYCLFSGQSYRTLQQMFWAEIKRTHQKVEDGAQSTSNEAPNRLSVPQHLFEALCQCSHDAWESGLVHTSLLPRVNQLLSEYLGTHSFHNFTPKGRSSDPSMKRFITKASAEVLELPSTLQVAAHGSESSKFLGKYVVQFQIHGQSFMLHQIRKMVSAVLLMVLGDVEGSLSRMLHKDVTLEIPMLPSNGLMLSNLTLEKYESRLAYIEKCKGRQVTHKEAGAEAFNMASFDDLVHKFREERIIPSCLEFEFNNRVMARWLLSASFPQTLDSIPAALMNAGHRDHHSISMKRGRVATDDVIPSSTSPYTERPP